MRVTFTDDAGNEETLTSVATDAVTAKPIPLTATLSNVPASHDGSSTFTFDLAFSENVRAGYARIRDHAFTIDEGDIEKAQRKGPRQQPDLDHRGGTRRQRGHRHHAALDHRLRRRRRDLHLRRPDALALDDHHDRGAGPVRDNKPNRHTPATGAPRAETDRERGCLPSHWREESPVRENGNPQGPISESNPGAG